MDEVPQWAALGEVGTMYYPSPAAKDFAFSRNTMEAMAAGLATPPGVRALMLLWKFGLVKSVPG
ncbi:MAG: hypothetical protein D4R93_01870 [Deltaproteobacteria bacterium]|nr:MAG: hypothetical protein D4R93_01870 [Deltaproteobacteria bacterium]